MKNLLKKKEQFEIISSIAQEVIWDWDLVKDTMWWNASYYNNFGYQRTESANLPESWKEGILREDRDRVLALLKDLINSKQKFWSAEYRFFKANFTILNIYSKGTVFYNETGEAVRIVASMIDVSEQKKTEEDLKKSNGELHDLSAYLQQEREKQNTSFAYEMHEQLGQELAGAHLGLSSIIEQLRLTDENLAAQLAGIDKILKASINKVRKISSELYPSILKDVGLIEALDAYGEKFMNSTGVSLMFSSEEEDIILSPENQIVLYRTFQQALANTVYHEATEVISTLRIENNNLLLTICDNGKNFIEAEEIKTSIAFLAMKERLAFINGSIHIDIDWIEGTNLKVMLPLAQPDKIQLYLH